MGHNRVLCKQCDYFSSTKRTMNHHIRTIHEGVLLSCSQCDFKSSTKQSLDVHTAFNHDSEVFNCGECDHKSRSKKALEVHKIICHGDKIHECDECQYKSARLSELKRHKRKHKTKVKQENRTRYCFNKNCKNILKEKCLEMEHNLLPCLDCEFMAFSKTILRNHKSKNEGRMFSCGQCDEKYKNKSQLREHLSDKHESKLLLICGQCDERFKTTAILNNHTKAVHNKVLCAECKYFTYGKITMKHHKRRVHEGLYLKHQCDYCSFHTNERGKLKTHISSIHEGQHTFCKRCDTNFKSEPSLKRLVQFDHEETSFKFDPTDEKKMVIIDGIKDTVQEKEMSDTSVPQLLQHCDAETQIQNLENSSKLKCNNCDFLAENPDISKLHGLSHKFSESDILETIPPRLKDLTFDSEEELSKTIDTFLVSLSSKVL